MSEPTIQLAGDDAVLARRYAGALYDLAEQENNLDAAAADLSGLRRLWNESAEWRQIACDPRFDNVQVAAAVAETAKSCAFGNLIAQFLAVVTQNRRLSLLPAMIETFLAQLAARRGEFNADVRVARPLAPAQREALTASLNAVVGGKVHLSVVEDPSILGGMTVKIGSQFIDASVKTKLDHLERTLKGAA